MRPEDLISDGDDEVLSLKDAFIAMYEFIFQYWNMDGRQDDAIIRLMGDIEIIPGREYPFDISTWDEWKKVAKEIKKRTS